jgi:hypothetical protein
VNLIGSLTSETQYSKRSGVKAVEAVLQLKRWSYGLGFESIELQR